MLAVLLGWGILFIGKRRKSIQSSVLETREAVETARRLSAQIISMGPAKEVPSPDIFVGKLDTIGRNARLEGVRINTGGNPVKSKDGSFLNHNIQVDIKNASLYSIVDFLHKVEYETPASISRIAIRRDRITARERYTANVVLVLKIPVKGK